MKVVDAHGARIPGLGFGTGGLCGEAGVAVVAEALAAGYRHFDTARSYGNEREVGEALRSSSVPRDQVFVTTKVWPDRLRAADLRRSAEESVEALGTGPADLLLIHWPNPSVPLRETLSALAAVKREGLARHVGVSNFSSKLISEAWAVTEEPLVANQCEYHPFLDQRALIAECRRHGMAFVAYMPLGRKAALDNSEIAMLAARHGQRPAQIILQWLMQQDGVCAVPKSTDAGRMRENADLSGLSLSPAEMDLLFSLGGSAGRLVPFPRVRRTDNTFDDFPEFAPDWSP